MQGDRGSLCSMFRRIPSFAPSLEICLRQARGHTCWADLAPCFQVSGCPPACSGLAGMDRGPPVWRDTPIAARGAPPCRLDRGQERCVSPYPIGCMMGVRARHTAERGTHATVETAALRALGGASTSDVVSSDVGMQNGGARHTKSIVCKVLLGAEDFQCMKTSKCQALC